jgi:phosphoserine phosphatase
MLGTGVGSAQKWAVVAVDLDGTLIHGTTASLHLGEWIGHRAVIEELERRFAAGEIRSGDVADGDAPYYRGRSIAEVAEAMAGTPCIDDIREGVEQLASRGVDAVLCTVGWSFAAQCIADRFGFSAVSGTVMRVDGDGILAGRVARYFEPEDKVSFLRDYCASRDLDMNQVVAIGDGRSDLPMFDAAGFSVGLNPSSAARAAASVSVDTHSFLDALRAGPGLLDG